MIDKKLAIKISRIHTDNQRQDENYFEYYLNLSGYSIIQNGLMNKLFMRTVAYLNDPSDKRNPNQFYSDFEAKNKLNRPYVILDGKLQSNE